MVEMKDLWQAKSADDVRFIMESLLRIKREVLLLVSADDGHERKKLTNHGWA